VPPTGQSVEQLSPGQIAGIWLGLLMFAKWQKKSAPRAIALEPRFPAERRILRDGGSLHAHAGQKVAVTTNKPRSLEIPQRYETRVEAEPGRFKNAEDATVADWRIARRLAEQSALPAPVGSDQLLRLARVFGIADDVPLLPRLRALAAS
jgi:hypothetical protein